MQPEDQETFEARWENAPEDIRALALAIAQGDVPDAGVLVELGPDALSRGYPAPSLDFTRDGRAVPYLATLLQEAVMAQNIDAVQTLISRGAQPSENHSETLFLAIERRTPGAPFFMLFPDYTASLPILRALLEAGANPNAQQHGFRAMTPLIRARGVSNIGALLLLLEYGADPWLRVPYPEGTGTRDSFMEAISSSAGSGVAAEMLFRVLRATRLPPGPEDQQQTVLANINSVVSTFASGTGPDARHTAWRLDQVLGHLGRALERSEETDRIRAGLTAFDYAQDGGWYLSEEDIHSRYDAPLSLPDKGDHVWGP